MKRFQTESEVIHYIYTSYLNRSEANRAMIYDKDRRSPELASMLFSKTETHFATSTILVTGSKGKGSVSHFLKAIIASQGKSAGIFVGPHLLDFKERIQVNHQMISSEDFIRISNKLYPHWEDIVGIAKADQYVGPVGIIATIAMEYFAEQHVDFAIFECGKGVASDDVGQIAGDFAVVNRIFEEHIPELGDNLDEVALNKSFLIQPGMKAVVSNYQSDSVKAILDKQAKDVEVPMYYTDKIPVRIVSDSLYFDYINKSGTAIPFKLNMLGVYQAENFTIAMRLAEEIFGDDLDVEKVQEKVLKIVIPGRMELFEFKGHQVLLDATIHRTALKSVYKTISYLDVFPRVAILSIPNSKDAMFVYHEACSFFDRVVLCGTTNVNMIYDFDDYDAEVPVYQDFVSAFESESHLIEGGIISILGTISFIRDAKAYFMDEEHVGE